MTEDARDLLIQKIAKDLAQNTQDTALVKQAIMGNGVKGLSQRMTDLELWRHSHPRVCPMEAAPNPRKVNGMNIFLGIVGAVGVIGSLIVAVVK